MHVRFQTTLPAILLTVAIGLAFATGDAQGGFSLRSFVQNATGTCQSALPVFEGQLRKRPLAIVNESTAPVFVSCSLMGTDRAFFGISAIQVLVHNTSAPTELTCTLVTGLSKVGTTHFLPKSTRTTEFFTWGAGDNGGANFNDPTINLSCLLPEGAGLSLIKVHFADDVGA